MDNIKEKIGELFDKVKNDPYFAKNFQENPVKTVEELTGMDLPDDKINEIITTVKAKISLDNAGDLFGKIKGFFD